MGIGEAKIGLGLAALGRPEYINIGKTRASDKTEIAFKENAFKVLDAAYKAGVRYFDTAPSYGKGEQFLYEWSVNKADKDIVLGTKWGYTYIANWEIGFSGNHEIKEHSISKLSEQWRFSKKLLPLLKIYQIHSATLESGVLENDEVLNYLAELKEQFNLKIGITTSGFNQSDIIKKAVSIKIDAKPLFDSFQITYNILENSTHQILKQLIADHKTVIVKEALANGRIFPNKEYVHYQNLYKDLTVLAGKYKVGTDAIALRFCMDYLHPETVLSGASSVHQLQENLKANRFKLSEEELNTLKIHSVSSVDYWNERSQLEWH
ncbi:aldo/keto reductase [Niabella ginsengisoli]|uniref:Aldo/keto reductase n=1 Tax=Niabella ginsengisoli TaxID=522298 RepID=A0ABS9SKS9_9BACT|nr:aldo/keto reductase [Niabella ginsengisoli]MCH5598915.1 aldo/keto reductase [Niabella ginsengisoli]